ncbi:MAG: ABC transporter permease [Bacteroidetes bacterium]|nr:ABC transporter permease [Bacteroidota bacterium]
MKIFKIIFKNAFRHKLRVFLTIIGISIAVMAFGLLRTVVTAWNAGVDASSANRLITRQAVSFVFPLPYADREQIAKIPGVDVVTPFIWFGGVYIEKKNFFARMACDPETVFDSYPEYLVEKENKEIFKKERNSCIIGEALAKQFKLKIGDVMNIDGDIFPGRWQFTIRGIYKPRDKTVDATQMLFDWKYVDERMKQDSPERSGLVGWYVVNIKDAAKSAEISERIDTIFKNSRAETKTETERAFQQGFVASSGAIITAMNVMAFVIIGIIMLVLGNTMIMSARERTREYAVLKTLGFQGGHLIAFIAGESLIISFMGGLLGLGILFPFVAAFEAFMPKGFFPVFNIAPSTVIIAASSALAVGFAASIFPIQRALKTSIVDGLRHIG